MQRENEWAVEGLAVATSTAILRFSNPQYLRSHIGEV